MDGVFCFFVSILPKSGDGIVQNRVVAGRYAAALLRSSVASGELDRVDQDLDQLVKALAAEETLGRFLDSPRETPETKKQLIDKAFGDKVSRIVRNLLLLLVDKKRVSLLPAIAQMYHEHADAVRGVAVAKVRVAQPLTAEAEELIRHELRQLTGRDVRLEVQLDPGVVGGMYLRVGNRVIDYTLQHQLDRLREDIIAGRSFRGAGYGSERKRVRWKHQE